ncbi:unnamed protein product, partial [Owenia fusiformis]
VNGTTTDKRTDIRLGVYGGIGVAQMSSVLIATLSLAFGATRASNILHEKLIVRIVKAPMEFFDTTPLGRILNRFSQDMNQVDTNIRGTLIMMLRGLSSIITTIIAISYTSPYFLIAFVPLSILYIFIQRVYVACSNQLRRLNSIRTSPIYSHFGESVTGACSIRAYNMQSSFIKQSDKLTDDMMMAKFPSIAVS